MRNIARFIESNYPLFYSISSNQMRICLYDQSWILSAQSYYCIHFWYKFFSYSWTVCRTCNAII